MFPIAEDSYIPCDWVHHIHSIWSAYQFLVAAVRPLPPAPHCQWNSSVLLGLSICGRSIFHLGGHSWAVQHVQATWQWMHIVGLLLTYLGTECTSAKKTLIKGFKANAIYSAFFHTTEISMLLLTQLLVHCICTTRKTHQDHRLNMLHPTQLTYPPLTVLNHCRTMVSTLVQKP